MVQTQPEEEEEETLQTQADIEEEEPVQMQPADEEEEQVQMQPEEEEESLQVKRRYPDRTTWEPKAGAFATIQRALGSKGRRFALANAQDVTGQATQLEPGFCHVGLAADVRPSRSRRLQGGAVVFALGALSTAAFAVTFGLVALVPAAVLIPTAAAIARHHRVENERVQIAMEQVLDRLERGEIRAEHALPGMGQNPFVRIAEEVRKALGAP